MARDSKPNHLKLVTGTVRKSRRRAVPEPTPAVTVPEPPGWFSDAARAAWADLAPRVVAMRTLAESDLVALETAARTLAEVRLLTVTIDREGRTYATRNMQGETLIRARPETRMLADAERRLVALLRHFGLTPASRGNVRVHAPPEDSRTDHFFS